VTAGLAAIASCVRCHAVSGIAENLVAAFAKVIEPFCATGSAKGIGRFAAEGLLSADAGFVIATPLSQTNFLPDLTQVNFFVAVELIKPALLHAAPAFGDAAKAVVGSNRDATKIAADAKAIFLIKNANPIQ
jgi:hypothetical protein